MAYPANMGDKQILREDFTSVQSVADNGGVLTNATILNGVMTCTNGGVIYQTPSSLIDLWDNGFTFRIRLRTDETATTFNGFFGMNISNDRKFTCTRRPSDGRYLISLRKETGDNYYSIDSVQGASTAIEEVVVTWNASTSTIYFYLDGALVASDAIPGAALVGTSAVLESILVGNNSVGGFAWVGEIHKNFQLIQGYWTAEEVKDAYEQDTYQELDAAKMDVSLPLRSWFTKETGSEKLVDGNMEAVGTDDWTIGGNTTATKETASPHSGTRNMKLLAQAVGGLAYPQARQAVLTVGKKYRVTGWARSDGTETPYITDGITRWTGTTSTDWQYFDVTFVAGTVNIIYVFTITDPGGTEFVEFDDLTVFEVLDQTNNLGTAGNATWGDGSENDTPTQLQPKGILIDTTQYVEVPVVSITSTKTWSVSYLVNVKDIATAGTHFHVELGVYTSDGFVLNQYGAALYLYWNSSGISWIVDANFFTNGLQHVSVSSDAGVISVYRNGELVNSNDLSAKAAFSGDYIFKFGNDVASSESDLFNLDFKTGVAWTPRQIRWQSQRAFAELNK